MPKLQPDDLKAWADVRATTSRLAAQTALAAMTVAEIRQIEVMTGFRSPSGATKSERINTLLLHLFDIPNGHEVIRRLRIKRPVEA